MGKEMSIVVSVMLHLLVSLYTTSAMNLDEWCVEHGTVYNGEQESIVRQSIFVINVQLVKKLNRQCNISGVGFTINHFAELSSTRTRV